MRVYYAKFFLLANAAIISNLQLDIRLNIKSKGFDNFVPLSYTWKKYILFRRENWDRTYASFFLLELFNFWLYYNMFGINHLL